MGIMIPMGQTSAKKKKGIGLVRELPAPEKEVCKRLVFLCCLSVSLLLWVSKSNYAA